MNMTLFKHQDSWFYIYYCKAKYPEGHTAVLLNANHAIRTDDAMHHSATGRGAISFIIFVF